MKLKVKKIYLKEKPKKVKLNRKVEKEHKEKTDLIENELKPREIPTRFLN